MASPGSPNPPLLDILRSTTPLPMTLNHPGFSFSNAASTAALFESYFGFTLEPDAGHSILQRPGFDVMFPQVDATTPHRPPDFHVGFELPPRAEIDLLHVQTLTAGMRTETGGINRARGSRLFGRAPGVMFELNTRADAAAAYHPTFSQAATGVPWRVFKLPRPYRRFSVTADAGRALTKRNFARAEYQA